MPSGGSPEMACGGHKHGGPFPCSAAATAACVCICINVLLCRTACSAGDCAAGISGHAEQGVQAGLHRVQCHHRRSVGHRHRVGPAARCRPVQKGFRCRRVSSSSAVHWHLAGMHKQVPCDRAECFTVRQARLRCIWLAGCRLSEAGRPCQPGLLGALPAHTDHRRSPAQPLHLAGRSAVSASLLVICLPWRL